MALIINVNKKLVDLFSANNIAEEFLKKLISIIREENNPIFFKIHKSKKLKIVLKSDIKLIYNINDFNLNEILRIENSLEPDDITEKAAIGFLFPYFLKKTKIRFLNVYNKRGKGYDYYWEEMKNDDEYIRISLECSGCNSNSNQTFNSRISNKKKKFEEKEWELLSDKKYVGIVDFCFKRYIIWEV
jgi:hypothetical protein